MTKFDPKDTYCPLLFQHFATHPYGGVTHCCIADHRKGLSSATNHTIKNDGNREYIVYLNVNKDKVEDIFNSRSFRKARTQVLNGEKPRACMRCYTEEAKGIKSKRIVEQENYPEYTIDVARKATDMFGFIEDVQFDFVELRLGNTCNVACRTCNPASSSKWRNDYNKLQKMTTFPITNYDDLESFKWPEREEFWEDLFNHTKNVKTFYINGGEPTLIKQHFKFLQRLINSGKTDVKLWYNINMTNLNTEILDIWDKFDNVKISCSIDDLRDRNYYIRYPTQWDTVIKNIDTLVAKGKYELDITQTVSFMNYPTLDDFYNFFYRDRNIWVHHNFVNDPDFLSPAVLPLDMREQLHDRFRSTFEDWKVNQLIEQFGKPQSQTQWEKCVEYTNKLDHIRDQNILDYIPELEPYWYENMA